MAIKRNFISRLFGAFIISSIFLSSGVAVTSCQKDPIENPEDGGDNSDDKPGDKPGDSPVVENPDGIEDPEVIPDGFSYLPQELNADKSCVFYYKAAGKDELVGYASDVYVYTGAVYDGDEWEFVPDKWGVNTDRCKAVKLAGNTWKFIVSPSIREWYGSGEQGLVQLGVIFRSSDGNKQTKPDFIVDVTDDKYVYDTFVPDPVVDEPVPSGAKLGINYNDDNSVTLVFYDKDNDGKHSEYCHVVGDFSLDENGRWTRKNEYAMKRDEDAGCWWITLGSGNIDGFDPDREYRFEYFLASGNSVTKVGDPFTEIVYDQWNDQYLSGYEDFPKGAKGLVSAFQVNKPQYVWKNDGFRIEDKNDLVIYELLFRDFSKTGDIKGAMAQMDYLENLGITAIELMPVQEFDGNVSWGYNPNHYFALDKAYGTREEYKQFIDECHKRGMAVIIDVVYNHATGSHPWAKLYWNGEDNCTADYNPWFNVTATHPYSVYHDWNHENTMVRDHVKESLEYLLTEYHVDGFRFDLSKGLTQKNTGSNVGAWSSYDASRVAIIRDYYDHIQSVNPNAIMILEHLGDSKEEAELSGFDAYPWRKMTDPYKNVVHGNKSGSNLSGAYANGFVAYMESHDEQRICYGATGSVSATDWGICGTLTGWGESTSPDYKEDIKLTQDGVFYVSKSIDFAANDRFKIREANDWDKGNVGADGVNTTLTVGEGFKLKVGKDSKDLVVAQAGKYDIYFSPSALTVWLMDAGAAAPDAPEEAGDDSALAVTMRRAGCAAAFFLTVPGPKMIWQFGELGYDISGGNGDTDSKPVKTDEFLANKYRKGLYDTYSGLLKFRKENPRFFDRDAVIEWYVSEEQWDYGRFLYGSVDGKYFAVIGNFSNETKDITAWLPVSGQWKDYSAFGDGTYTVATDSDNHNSLSFNL
ncbi:MAG: alpha-amylase family glycosyl hydrolase, partial [Candidatus Cryptobacteroides sp.]